MVDFAKLAGRGQSAAAAPAAVPAAVDPMLGRQVELEDLPLYRFTESGQQLEGFLLDIESNGSYRQFVIEEVGTRKVWKVNETAALRKIRPEFINHKFIITFRGKNPEIGTEKGNAMSDFSITVSQRARK